MYKHIASRHLGVYKFTFQSYKNLKSLKSFQLKVLILLLIWVQNMQNYFMQKAGRLFPSKIKEDLLLVGATMYRPIGSHRHKFCSIRFHYIFKFRPKRSFQEKNYLEEISSKIQT